ncbi:MAG: cytochrome-c peroxidase [Nitrospinaceae bacterium]|nr:cytochrome-c peroxidase [Nitrospinaceae bacterium]
MKLLKMAGKILTVGGVFLLTVTLTGVTLASEKEYDLEIPLGLDEDLFHIPKDNPLTKEKVALGHLLYFDKRLSKNGTIACATCHMPALAFTDGQPVSTGIHRQQGGRSAPTSINRGFSKAQFWDGRAATLEDQSVGPLTNPVEHGFVNNDEVVSTLNKIAGYGKLFKEAFGVKPITIQQVGKAIASFQRTLISGNSPFDRFDWMVKRRPFPKRPNEVRNSFSVKPVVTFVILEPIFPMKIFTILALVGEARWLMLAGIT